MCAISQNEILEETRHFGLNNDWAETMRLKPECIAEIRDVDRAIDRSNPDTYKSEVRESEITYYFASVLNETSEATCCCRMTGYSEDLLDLVHNNEKVLEVAVDIVRKTNQPQKSRQPDTCMKIDARQERLEHNGLRRTNNRVL